MARKDALLQVETIKKQFEEYMMIPLTYSFDRFSFPITIQRVDLLTQKELHHKPEKRQREDRRYTPYVLGIETTTGETMEYILEDIQVHNRVNAIHIQTGNNTHVFAHKNTEGTTTGNT